MQLHHLQGGYCLLTILHLSHSSLYIVERQVGDLIFQSGEIHVDCRDWTSQRVYVVVSLSWGKMSFGDSWRFRLIGGAGSLNVDNFIS